MTHTESWSWYIIGPALGFLLILMHKMNLPLRLIFTGGFIDHKSGKGNLLFAAGIILGGFITVHFFGLPEFSSISSRTVSYMNEWDISNFSGVLAEKFTSGPISCGGFYLLITGGLFLGFGLRYLIVLYPANKISNNGFSKVILLCSILCGAMLITWIILPEILKAN